MTLAFGTDGVRGVANVELTPELVVALGRAAARVLGPGPWLVGRDTRISGPMLYAALAAGLAAEGAGVVDLGVVPTPAVASACAARNLPGAMISASHNPFADNGVKLFAAGGHKLDDDLEKRIEDGMSASFPVTREHTVVGASIGTLSRDVDATAAYADRVLAAVAGRSLSGMRVVLDCANGAASSVAGDIFARAGADVVVRSNSPDGVNINDGCGSTHPQALRAAVLAESDGTVGLAFDGDADRVLAVAEDGQLVDGDQILALCAIDLRDRHLLRDDTVVVTVMSNLGFRLSMEAAGIRVVETSVGDRYVLEELRRGGFSLGGEQSGHVIFPAFANTGDGILTGLVVCDLVRRSGRSLAELASSVMERLPQVLVNVRVRDAARLGDSADIWEEARKVEAGLGGRGRVLLRASGTEPLVRVMVEAPTAARAEEAAAHLAEVVQRSLGDQA